MTFGLSGTGMVHPNPNFRERERELKFHSQFSRMENSIPNFREREQKWKIPFLTFPKMAGNLEFPLTPVFKSPDFDSIGRLAKPPCHHLSQANLEQEPSLFQLDSKIFSMTCPKRFRQIAKLVRAFHVPRRPCFAKKSRDIDLKILPQVIFGQPRDIPAYCAQASYHK